MHADVAVGAEIELATRGDVRALAGKVDGLGGMLRRRDRPMWDTLIPNSAVAMPAAGAGVIAFDGPPPGQLWDIRQLVWVAGDDHTAVANASCAAYIGTDVGQLVGQLLLPGQPIPGHVEFPEDVAKMHPGEILVLLFYGVAAGTALTGVARVAKWDDRISQANLVG